MTAPQAPAEHEGYDPYDGQDAAMVAPCIGCPGCHTGGPCIDDPDADWECPGCGELNGDCAPACPYADDPDENYEPVTLRPVVDVATGDLL